LESSNFSARTRAANKKGSSLKKPAVTVSMKVAEFLDLRSSGTVGRRS
jgi:hypothetical protein